MFLSSRCLRHDRDAVPLGNRSPLRVEEISNIRDQGRVRDQRSQRRGLRGECNRIRYDSLGCIRCVFYIVDWC